ncbi:eukaryotic and archaeal DNA primase, large subunit domain-containing protein [Phthorimaea operculella]|nr:eukaryotic and archaeal DNA primase, large subunit domain-containing protein [Phthorimaea operculella]
MSFFYLTPVQGDMPVYLLETIVNKRLEYLKSVLRQDLQIYNEYVVEGSTYDNVGHFMLCVVVILGENFGVTQFFLKAELELFKRRLNSLSAYDMRFLCKKIIRTIKKQENTPLFIDPLQILCQHLVLKDVAHHICSTAHDRDCCKHNIKLHFKHCLSFVAKRQVEVQNGNVILPCGKWKQYLAQLFMTNLKYRLSKCNLSPLKSDPRVMEILAKLKNELPVIRRNMGELLSKEVDITSKLFPPCMLNLHQYLRRKHRLSHTQRFYYSLFLKDIGMPVEEAVEFWRLEYRQIANSHSCSHNWERDEKKYLYSVRHMYGLEGCRKNYTSVSCQRIQSSDTSCSEGGCPFKSFDSQRLLQILKSQNNLSDPEILQINELKRRHQYTSACLMYLQKSIHSVDCDNVSFNFSPVKYYLVASKNRTDD